MDSLQEYKELYYKEIEHSERLNNKSNVSITFLTVLGSAQIFLWTQFKTFECSVYSIIYFILCIISLVFFIISAYKFYFTYSSYKYNYFPIDDMVNASIETYKIAGDNPENVKLAKEHIHNMYCERFLNDAIANRKENILKNDKHKKLTKMLCISLIITAMVFIYGVFIDYYETKYIDNNITHIIIEGGEINVR